MSQTTGRAAMAQSFDRRNNRHSIRLSAPPKVDIEGFGQQEKPDSRPRSIRLMEKISNSILLGRIRKLEICLKEKEEDLFTAAELGQALVERYTSKKEQYEEVVYELQRRDEELEELFLENRELVRRNISLMKQSDSERRNTLLEIKEFNASHESEKRNSLETIAQLNARLELSLEKNKNLENVLQEKQLDILCKESFIREVQQNTIKFEIKLRKLESQNKDLKDALISLMNSKNIGTEIADELLESEEKIDYLVKKHAEESEKLQAENEKKVEAAVKSLERSYEKHITDLESTVNNLKSEKEERNKFLHEFQKHMGFCGLDLVEILKDNDELRNSAFGFDLKEVNSGLNQQEENEPGILYLSNTSKEPLLIQETPDEENQNECKSPQSEKSTSDNCENQLAGSLNSSELKVLLEEARSRCSIWESKLRAVEAKSQEMEEQFSKVCKLDICKDCRRLRNLNYDDSAEFRNDNLNDSFEEWDSTFASGSQPAENLLPEDNVQLDKIETLGVDLNNTRSKMKTNLESKDTDSELLPVIVKVSGLDELNSPSVKKNPTEKKVLPKIDVNDYFENKNKTALTKTHEEETPINEPLEMSNGLYNSFKELGLKAAVEFDTKRTSARIMSLDLDLDLGALQELLSQTVTTDIASSELTSGHNENAEMDSDKENIEPFRSYKQKAKPESNIQKLTINESIQQSLRDFVKAKRIRMKRTQKRKAIDDDEKKKENQMQVQNMSNVEDEENFSLREFLKSCNDNDDSNFDANTPGKGEEEMSWREFLDVVKSKPDLTLKNENENNVRKGINSMSFRNLLVTNSTKKLYKSSNSHKRTLRSNLDNEGEENKFEDEELSLTDILRLGPNTAEANKSDEIRGESAKSGSESLSLKAENKNEMHSEAVVDVQGEEVVSLRDILKMDRKVENHSISGKEEKPELKSLSFKNLLKMGKGKKRSDSESRTAIQILKDEDSNNINAKKELEKKEKDSLSLKDILRMDPNDVNTDASSVMMEPKGTKVETQRIKDCALSEEEKYIENGSLSLKEFLRVDPKDGTENSSKRAITRKPNKQPKASSFNGLMKPDESEKACIDSEANSEKRMKPCTLYEDIENNESDNFSLKDILRMDPKDMKDDNSNIESQTKQKKQNKGSSVKMLRRKERTNQTCVESGKQSVAQKRQECEQLSLKDFLKSDQAELTDGKESPRKGSKRVEHESNISSEQVLSENDISISSVAQTVNENEENTKKPKVVKASDLEAIQTLKSEDKQQKIENANNALSLREFLQVKPTSEVAIEEESDENISFREFLKSTKDTHLKEESQPHENDSLNQGHPEYDTGAGYAGLVYVKLPLLRTSSAERWTTKYAILVGEYLFFFRNKTESREYLLKKHKREKPPNGTIMISCSKSDFDIVRKSEDDCEATSSMLAWLQGRNTSIQAKEKGWSGKSKPMYQIRISQNVEGSFVSLNDPENYNKVNTHDFKNMNVENQDLFWVTKKTKKFDWGYGLKKAKRHLRIGFPSAEERKRWLDAVSINVSNFSVKDQQRFFNSGWIWVGNNEKEKRRWELRYCVIKKDWLLAFPDNGCDMNDVLSVHLRNVTVDPVYSKHIYITPKEGGGNFSIRATDSSERMWWIRKIRDCARTSSNPNPMSSETSIAAA